MQGDFDMQTGRPKPPWAVYSQVEQLYSLKTLNPSLTSIDDVPWGNVIRPRITMVVQPVDEMARIATEFLLDRIASRGNAIAPREHVLIPKLVVGQSVVAPRA